MKSTRITIGIAASMLLNSAAAQPFNDELESVWDLQRTILQSVIIQCRTVEQRISPEKNLSPEQVHKMLAKAVSADDDTFRDMVLNLDPSLKAAADLWTKGKYVFDSENVREDLVLGGLIRSHVWHRESFIVKDPHNRQMTLQPRAKSSLRVPQIEDFVFLPPPGMFRAVEVACKGDRIVFSKGNVQLVVERETGFIEEFHRGTYPGRLVEVFQYGMTVIGDVAVPKWRFRGEYAGKGLRTFTLRVIDDVELAAARDEAFAVPAEPQTVIVDERRQEAVPIRIQLPVNDVRTLDVDTMSNGTD